MIFIVDDDPSVRRSLARLLRSAGLEARAYPSADEFLAAGEPCAGSCAIVDIHMPGMSGMELLDMLSGRPQPVPVIILTAFEDAAVRAEAVAGGAVAFLKKPFDDSALLAAVATAMGSNRP